MTSICNGDVLYVTDVDVNAPNKVEHVDNELKGLSIFGIEAIIGDIKVDKLNAHWLLIEAMIGYRTPAKLTIRLHSYGVLITCVYMDGSDKELLRIPYTRIDHKVFEKHTPRYRKFLNFICALKNNS